MSDASARLVLDRPPDAPRAAALLADGHARRPRIGTIYALTGARGRRPPARRAEGRPLDQTDSLTAPTGQVLDAFDLPSTAGRGVGHGLVQDVVDAFGALGPFRLPMPGRGTRP